MANKTNVIKFTDAIGSKPDSPENGPLNVIGIYEATRFSTKDDVKGGRIMLVIYQTS